MATQPLEAQLQPDGEQQQDDAELGEGLDRLRVGDGDGLQPGIGVGHSAPRPNGPAITPTRMKPMTGDDLQPGEGRDDDPGRAEDRQRVAESPVAPNVMRPAMARLIAVAARLLSCPCRRGYTVTS